MFLHFDHSDMVLYSYNANIYYVYISHISPNYTSLMATPTVTAVTTDFVFAQKLHRF